MSDKSFTVELEVRYDPEAKEGEIVGTLILPNMRVTLDNETLAMLADKYNLQQAHRRIVELETQVEQKGGGE